MNAVSVSRRRLARRLALPGLLLVCLFAPPAVAATPGAGNLSPRLAELSSPAVRSLAPAQQAERLDLARSGAASLIRVGDRVVVGVRFDHGAGASVDALRAAGAEILDVSRRYQTVTVAAKPEDLPPLGAVAGVGAVTEVLSPVVRGADCGGSARSEGDAQLNVPSARASWGVDGSGVTVGVLSDSFDRRKAAATHAANDVFSGDLPGPGSPCGSSQPVGVLSDPEAGGADEGRAMAQIVHDLAPGAAIDFATAVGGQTAFANNIRALAAAGARVIADDVIYLEEPFFQDGPVAVAINEVVAAGVSYFTAAGNDNVVAAGQDTGSFEAQFVSAGTCPAGVPPGEGTACADFDPGAGSDDGYDMTVAPGKEVILDLQWAEPWGGVGTDLDAFLLDGSGGVLAESTDRNVTNTQRPFEALAWKNEGVSMATVELAIPRFSGAGSPRLKFIQIGNGSVGMQPTPEQYATSSAGDTIGPTIIGHSGAESAISTGAVFFADSTEPEEYSSRGPVIHFFGPVNGISPAPAIGEEVISKPDLVATDCGVTTFFASKKAGQWRFCGTSASAPHAAAVAALMRQANPGASPGQIRAALLATALPVDGFGADAVGAGLPDAYAAVNSVALPPAITITKPPATVSRERRPAIEFGANRPVAFACSLDGSPPQPCASPYQVPTALADGKHGFLVTGTDLGGRVGASPIASFTVDTKPPRTKIAKHPPKLVRTKHRRARVVFGFRSSEGGAKFVCKVDRNLRRFCGKRLALRLEAGRHRVLAKALDAAGNIDPTAAVFHFRVKRVG